MEELEALLEVIGVGVLDDDISVMQRGLEEELVGHGEGEVSAIEAEEDGGDKGVAEEGGLGGMGVEGGGEEGEVEDSAGLVEARKISLKISRDSGPVYPLRRMGSRKPATSRSPCPGKQRK